MFDTCSQNCPANHCSTGLIPAQFCHIKVSLNRKDRVSCNRTCHPLNNSSRIIGVAAMWSTTWIVPLSLRLSSVSNNLHTSLRAYEFWSQWAEVLASQWETSKPNFGREDTSKRRVLFDKSFLQPIGVEQQIATRLFSPRVPERQVATCKHQYHSTGSENEGPYTVVAGCL